MADVLETTDTPNADDAPEGDPAAPDKGAPTDTGQTPAKADAEAEPEEGKAEELPTDSPETKKLKRESQGLRTRLRDAEKRESGLQTEVAPLRERLQTIDLDAALSAQKDEIGARDPDVVKALILARKSSLQFDYKGGVTGLDSVLKAIKEEFPTLFFGPGSADGGEHETAPVLDRAAWFRKTFVGS